MKIYNRTNQVQELQVYDRNTNRSHSIYLDAKSSTTLDMSLATPSLPKLVSAGVFQILDTVESPAPTVETHEDHVSPEVEDDTSDISENPEEETHEESPSDVTEETEDTPEHEHEEEEVTKFICDICNGEFASQRSLTMHKNKVHS